VDDVGRKVLARRSAYSLSGATARRTQGGSEPWCPNLKAFNTRQGRPSFRQPYDVSERTPPNRGMQRRWKGVIVQLLNLTAGDPDLDPTAA
jgi:hypothetical protein